MHLVFIARAQMHKHVWREKNRKGKPRLFTTRCTEASHSVEFISDFHSTGAQIPFLFLFMRPQGRETNFNYPMTAPFRPLETNSGKSLQAATRAWKLSYKAINSFDSPGLSGRYAQSKGLKRVADVILFL